MQNQEQNTSKDLVISEPMLESFPDAVDKPQITREEYNKLPRVDRMFQSILWPRHFRMTDSDTKYLDALKVAHACLRNYSTDSEAMSVLRHAIEGRTLSMGEVLHLVRDSKQLFGQFVVRDKDFDREKIRRRLYANADKAHREGDIDAERKALRAIIDLDEKDNSNKSGAPIVPELPDVTFTSAEDAIIEASEEIAMD